MAFQYIGDANRVYSEISVDGSTLCTVVGQSYEIDDPGDGRWTSTTTAKTAPVVAPEPAETASETPTDPAEGK